MPAMLKPIATKAEFTLFDRSDLAEHAAKSGWRNLKLVKTGKGPKRNWWLAWNGERLARGRDLLILSEHNPEIESWIIETLTAERFSL